MMLKELQTKIADAIEADFDVALKEYSFEVGYSKEAKFGDFFCNASLVLSKPLKRSPREVAEEVAAVIQKAIPDIAKTEIAGPGFINVYMKSEFWSRELMKIDADYARLELGKGKKVQVEYISANPTGPLTIGNGRGGFIGEVLARVLARAGYDVTREYYFNDAGTQISKLLESVKAEAGLTHPEERQYNGAYIKDLAEKFAAELKTKPDDELKKMITGEITARYIMAALTKMGIEFD